MTTNEWRAVSRSLLCICHIVLLVASAAWLLARPSPEPWLILLTAVMIAPLLFAIRGLIRERIDTYRWLSLVLVINNRRWQHRGCGITTHIRGGRRRHVGSSG